MSYIILLITILCITGSALWSSGTIVLLDYVIMPHWIVNWYEPLFFPIFATMTGLLGAELISRFIFVGILILGANLGILIARWIASEFEYDKNRCILEIFGGIFFIINPFVYERMMVQPTIMLGIYLLGYVVYFLFFVRSTIIAGIFAGIALMVMPHASYMILLIFGFYLICYVRSTRSFYYLLMSGFVIIVINLNWILAPYFGHTNSISSVSTFSSANLEAFQTQALAPMGVWGTNILLYGFWGERYGNHYVNVGFLSSLWHIAGLVFLLFVGYGGYLMYRKNKKTTLSFICIGFLSLIFGIGIASSITSGLTTWMIENIPLWKGYREPQKWIGLLMIVQGIGFLIGLGYILQRWSKDIIIQISIIISMVLIFLVWTPGSLMGYHGQLKNTIYPGSFETFRNQNIGTFSGQILALPWHSYIGCSWIARTAISNPIIGLLAPLPVISADNIEVGSILYSNSISDRSRDIERFLDGRDTELLKKHDITHIFLMRSCASSQRMEESFDLLEQSGSLIQLESDDTYRFYQIP